MKSFDAIKIWALGSHVQGIGKSLSWDTDSFPSFEECDVLIVDTATLDEKTLRSITPDNRQKLFEDIARRIKTGLTIICIVSKTFTIVTDGSSSLVSNYFWSPFGFWFVS